MSKKSTANATAVAMTRELFSIVGDAGKVVGGKEALTALRTGLGSVLPNDPMSKAILSQLGTPGGDIMAALLMKGFQSWADPKGVSSTAADAAIDAAFLQITEAIDLKTVMQKMQRALTPGEKNNTTATEKATTLQDKAEPKQEAKAADIKPVVIACEACGDAKAKRSKLKAFTIPDGQKGLVPEADKQEGKQLCSTCIKDLNTLLREAADAKSIDAAKAAADKELLDGIEAESDEEKKRLRLIEDYRIKIQRLTDRANAKKQSINKLMQSGKSDKDLPDVNVGKYPDETDPIWKDLFGDFHRSGYDLVTEYQTIMVDLLAATASVAQLEASPEQEEKREAEAAPAAEPKAAPAEKNNTLSKTKQNATRRQRQNAKKKGKK